MTVRSNFSLHRTYIIFRTLGLRHLTVTELDGGEVVGMITRRDLMGFSLEEKLDKVGQNISVFETVENSRAGQPNPSLQNTHDSNISTGSNQHLNSEPQTSSEIIPELHAAPGKPGVISSSQHSSRDPSTSTRAADQPLTPSTSANDQSSTDVPMLI